MLLYVQYADNSCLGHNLTDKVKYDISTFAWGFTRIIVLVSVGTYTTICRRDKDDLYQLYAAFHFGKGTHLISADDFDDHRHLLPHDLRFSFLKWQRRYQITSQQEANTVSGLKNISGVRIKYPSNMLFLAGTSL